MKRSAADRLVIRLRCLFGKHTWKCYPAYANKIPSHIKLKCGYCGHEPQKHWIRIPPYG